MWVPKLFAWLRGGDFLVDEDNRSCRPFDIDDDNIKALLRANEHSIMRELTTILKVSIERVHGRLNKLETHE